MCIRDSYIGGVEHAVLHLLYARFWHKALHDLGYLSSEEPFRTYFSQGYIQAPAYTDARGQYVEASQVQEGVDDAGRAVFTWQGQPVTREFGKIGKSLKNMVSPDDMYDAFGADTLRADSYTQQDVYKRQSLDCARPGTTRPWWAPAAGRARPGRSAG